MTDRKRRTLARADHQVVLACEDEGERESAAQTRQRDLDRLDRAPALLHLLADEMRHHFGVGFRTEFDALGFQLFAQLAEILDDAVMHDREPVGRVRMRVAFVGTAMGRPAGMADAGHAFKRLAPELGFQILQFAFGAAALEMAVFHSGDAGGIVAAIFQPLQGIDQLAGDGFAAENPDNPAHRLCLPSRDRPAYG